MRFISEAETARRVTREMAFASAWDALVAAATDGVTFPAALLPLGETGRRLSVKAGAMAARPGVKIGSFWPDNPANGLPSHSSLILLVDEETGRIDTIVEASRANAMRTAAADAVAASALARAEAETLAVFGAGQQAFFEIQALIAVRPIRQVLLVNRSPETAAGLVAKLAALEIPAAVADAEAACRAADIIVTATPARSALFEAEWVQDGAHIAAMGADGPGKQELPADLLRHATLFCDLPGQAVALGEFQSVADDVAAGDITLTAIGDVLLGRHPGRASAEEITIFDSSGLALQDLSLALRLADTPHPDELLPRAPRSDTFAKDASL